MNLSVTAVFAVGAIHLEGVIRVSVNCHAVVSRVMSFHMMSWHSNVLNCWLLCYVLNWLSIRDVLNWLAVHLLLLHHWVAPLAHWLLHAWLKKRIVLSVHIF